MIFGTKWVLEQIVGAKDKAHEDSIVSIRKSHGESLGSLHKGYNQTIEVLRKENERLIESLSKENARADAAIDRLLEDRAKVDGIRHAFVENIAAKNSVSDRKNEVKRDHAVEELDRIGKELNSVLEDEGRFSDKNIEVAGGTMPAQASVHA